MFWLTLHCVSADFRREADDNCVLLSCYAVSNGNFVPTFRNKISVPSSRIRIFSYSWSLRMGTICRNETSEKKYHHSPRIKPKGHGSLLTLHYLFCIAQPKYAAQFYWFTIPRSTVNKHVITRFSPGVSSFILNPDIFLQVPIFKQLNLNPSYYH